MWRQKREDTEKLLDPAWQAKYVKHLERYQHQAKEEARVRPEEDAELYLQVPRPAFPTCNQR